LQRLKAGDFDAIILAAAGIHRLGIWNAQIMNYIYLFDVLPAAGQGALAVQCRADDKSTREKLSSLDHSHSRRAVEIERSLVKELQGDCHSPIAVYVAENRLEAEDDEWRLQAGVAGRGGEPPLIYVELTGGDEIAIEAAWQLKSRGAMALLHGSK
jgi:hydroxymethylbilane synthase